MSEPPDQVMINLPKETQDLILSAESGDLNAQFRLGVHYRNGDAGLTQDLSMAHHWILLAARSGHIHAQNLEGVLLLKEGGWGGPTPPSPLDQFKALYWYHEAAMHGHNVAHHRFKDLIMNIAGSDFSDQLIVDNYMSFGSDDEYVEVSAPNGIEDPELMGIFSQVEELGNACTNNFPQLYLTSANWEDQTAVFSMHIPMVDGVQCPSCEKFIYSREVIHHIWCKQDVDGHPVRIEFLLPRFLCEVHGIIPIPLPAGLLDVRNEWVPSNAPTTR